MITLDSLNHDMRLLATSLKHNLIITLGILLLLYVIGTINYLYKYRLNYFGIVPRTARGLIGIITSPFLHGDSNHLFYNSIPLFFLMNVILIQGRIFFLITTLIIILLSGFFIWLGGRRGVHIGASTLILGYLGYIIANSYLAPSFLTIGSTILIAIYLGGLFTSLIPQKKEISFEGHIFGFISGMFTYFISPFIMATFNLPYLHTI